MTHIHIEGFGLTGCLLAYHLDLQGISFTWSDIDAPKTAWKASTGAIYPAGSTKFGPDALCYDVWDEWVREGLMAQHVEAADYWFGSKAAPHQGRYAVSEPNEFGMRRALIPSYHFNAQSFVPAMREVHKFKRWTGEGHSKGAQRVIAHGFGERLGRAYWGWTRLVRIGYRDRAAELQFRGHYARLDLAQRPCFYFRPSKVVMAYAYPVPGTEWWYAGSSIIAQRADRMKELDMPPKYERWKRLFLEFSKGALTIEREGDYLQGWRPAAGDNRWVTHREDGALLLRPLWNSGIRHFPMQLAQLFNAIGHQVPLSRLSALQEMRDPVVEA